MTSYEMAFWILWCIPWIFILRLHWVDKKMHVYTNPYIGGQNVNIYDNALLDALMENCQGVINKGPKFG